MLENDPLVASRRIPFEKLTWGKKLSKGAYGEVWVAHLEGHGDVAVKKLISSKRYQPQEIDAFAREIQLTANLSHPNIVRFIGVIWTCTENLSEVLEYLDGGDLQHVLRQRGNKLSWRIEKSMIAVDVANAIQYLHTKTPSAVLHRDIKAKNVLLTSTMQAKLVDFGVSRRSALDGQTMTSGVGTMYWAAPEILMGNKYSEKADIYSFGILLSEMDTGQSPYTDVRSASGQPMQAFQVLRLVIEGTIQPNFTASCPAHIRLLGLKCLNPNPQARPSARDIVQMLIDGSSIVASDHSYEF